VGFLVDLIYTFIHSFLLVVKMGVFFFVYVYVFGFFFFFVLCCVVYIYIYIVTLVLSYLVIPLYFFVLFRLFYFS